MSGFIILVAIVKFNKNLSDSFKMITIVGSMHNKKDRWPLSIKIYTYIMYILNIFQYSCRTSTVCYKNKLCTTKHLESQLNCRRIRFSFGVTDNIVGICHWSVLQRTVPTKDLSK